MSVSPQRRLASREAPRGGTVPRSGLGAFAVGLESFIPALDEELQRVRAGGHGFKAVRGEYGSGKTFFSRWLQERARRLGLATDLLADGGVLLDLQGTLGIRLQFTPQTAAG